MNTERLAKRLQENELAEQLAEQRRRVQTILTRLIADAAELSVQLVNGDSLDKLNERTIAGLGEYAGMLDDAMRGRQPHDKGSRTKKVRKAFGYTAP